MSGEPEAASPQSAEFPAVVPDAAVAAPLVVSESAREPAEPRAQATLAGEVDTLFEMIRYPDLGSLREKIAVFKRIARNPSGFPTVRPGDCMGITDELKTFFITHQRRFVTGDTYLIGHFLAMVEDFRLSDLSFYPNEVMRLDLLKAEALIAAGRFEEGLALVSPIAQRPYLVEDDYGMLMSTMEIDTLARLTAGRVKELRKVSIGRTRLMTTWRPWEARDLFLRMASVLAFGREKNGSLSDNIIVSMAICVVLLRRWEARHKFLRPVISYMGPEFILSAIAGLALFFTRNRWSGTRIQIDTPPEEAAQTRPLERVVTVPEGKRLRERDKPILISRAMGGLGDVAMMTPGVNIVARRFRKPVYFATKRSFFPLFENNPNVRLIDIEKHFDISQFRRWYNLSNCPASRYEVVTAPMIKKGRVETFAGGMSVSRWMLQRYGWRPDVPLSAEQREIAERFRSENASPDRPMIGVQPYSRDNYKNCDAIFDAARTLSKHYRIVMMHTSPLPIEESENILVIIGRPLREVLAITSTLDYYISVDSAFYHLTAAFNVPTLGIFGPTDGKTLSRHHPRYRLLRQNERFPCAPCWRNEDSPCVLTRNNRSVCLTGITSDLICTEFEALRRQFPLSGDVRAVQAHRQA